MHAACLRSMSASAAVLKVACHLLTVRLPLVANAVQVSCDNSVEYSGPWGCSCWLLMLPAWLQVSCDDPDEYKRTLRGQLRALLEREKDPLGPAEWVVCHVKQATPSDGLLKGPRKVGAVDDAAFQQCMLGKLDHVDGPGQLPCPDVQRTCCCRGRACWTALLCRWAPLSSLQQRPLRAGL